MMQVLLLLTAEALGGATACDVNAHWRAIRTQPLSQLLSLELATDRTEYVTGEAVEFSVILRNLSEHRVEGSVADLVPPSRVLRIDYQRDDEPKRTLDRGTLGDGLIRVRGSIEPEGSAAGRNFRGVDRARDDFMLDAPGVYRYTATLCDTTADLNSLVVSNTVSVDVRPVPASQQAAWEAYTAELAAFGERLPFPRQSGPQLRERAYAFVEQFPDSPWAIILRRRLLSWGPSPGFSAPQRERYERLRAAARQRGEKRLDGQEP